MTTSNAAHSPDTTTPAGLLRVSAQVDAIEALAKEARKWVEVIDYDRTRPPDGADLATLSAIIFLMSSRITRASADIAKVLADRKGK